MAIDEVTQKTYNMAYDIAKSVYDNSRHSAFWYRITTLLSVAGMGIAIYASSKYNLPIQSHLSTLGFGGFFIMSATGLYKSSNKIVKARKLMDSLEKEIKKEKPNPEIMSDQTYELLK